MSIKRSNSQGSILIEALLSVMILSVSITLMIQAMTSSLRASVYSADYTKAALLLDNKLQEIFETQTIPSGKNETGLLSAKDDQFKYLLTPASLSDENLQGINEMDLEVNWKSGEKTNRIKLKTYLFDEQ